MNGQVIEVSKCIDLTKSLIVLGYSGQVGPKDHLDRIHRLLDAGCDYRKQGAATLGFVSVAAGRVEAYYEPRINVWDIAAGAVLVRSAGGVIIHPYIPDFLQTPGEVLAANKNALVVGEICRNTSKNFDIADQMDR
jgi:myo-inositol-1(or 4)-monophosphatase